MLLCLLAGAAHLVLPSSHADDGEVVSSTTDMQGDGEPDRTERRPDEGPGEVRIKASNVGAGTGEIVLRGRTTGDRFGEDVAILTGPSNYAAHDLIVGAPKGGTNKQGEAYVFFGPFEIPSGQSELVLTADDADITLRSAWDDDVDFGHRVAPLYDITGDGWPELRVRSSYTPTDDVEYVITQVFRSDPTDGYSNGGELLYAAVELPCNGGGFWTPLDGDAIGDQTITVNDFMRVAINFGSADPDLTRFDGDLNGDEVIDAADFELVLNNMDTLGSIVVYGQDIPEVEANEIPVLNYVELAWFAVTPDIIPVRPGIPVDPVDQIDPCEDRPDCCDEPEIDPCDIDICDPLCSYRSCEPACDPGEVEDPPFGPCHPACPDRFCNAGCGFDDDFNPYGKCHKECDLLPPCHALCEPHCNAACEDGDPCGLSCSNRECDPACGGDPCDPGCWKSGCNPDCGGDPCGPDCDWAPCTIECGGSACSAGCPDWPCNPLCGTGDPICEYACGGDPCNPGCSDIDPSCIPECGGDPECNPECNPEVDPWCNSNCGGDPGNSGCGGGGGGAFECPVQEVCAWSTSTFCMPWTCPHPHWRHWYGWCLDECDGDPECEPHDWTWSVAGAAEIVTEPVPPDADIFTMRYADVEFTAPGGATLFLSDGCCTYRREFEVVPLPDLCIDSQNVFGYDTPECDESIENLEDDPSLPGKFIFANTGDRDGDGVPGFADGFDFDPLFDDDDASEGDQFVPMRLVIPSGMDASQITFSYDASPPHEMLISHDPSEAPYMPAPGLLRIWRKDGSELRNMASVADGGDYIAPNYVYDASDFGLPAQGVDEVTLWIEAVRPSQAIGDASIVVMVGKCADVIRLTAIGTQVVNVNQDGSIAEAGLPNISHPTPTINTYQFELTNVRVTEDNERVLADLVVAGSIEDALSNLWPGPDGIIDALHVRLNGEPAQVIDGSEPVVIGVSFTKDSGGGAGSLLKPFEYSGTFATVVEGLEIQPGWNTVQLLAQNSAGYTGFSERAFELRPNPPPDVDLDLRIEFYTDDLILVTLQIDGQDAFPKDFFYKTGEGKYTHPNFGSTVVVPADVNPATADSFLAEITHEPDDLSSVYISVTKPDPFVDTFEGATLLEEAHRVDWTGYVFDLESITSVASSSGGAFEPFLIEVLGPEELLASVQDLTLTSEFTNAEGNDISHNRTYALAEFAEAEGRKFLSLEGNEFPEVMLALPSMTVEELLGGPVGEWREGAWEFTQGFGAGFVDTGVDLVDSIGAVGKLGWHAIKNYNTISVVWRIAHGEGYLLEEDQQKISIAWNGLTVIATAAWNLHQGQQDYAYALLTGDDETINELGDQYRVVMEIAVELMEAVNDAIADMDDYEVGRVTGRITGEVALEVGLVVFTGGAGNAAKKAATMAKVIDKLDDLPTGIIPQAVKNKFDELLQAASQIGNAPEGEKAASVIARIRKDFPDLEHWDTFVVMLEKTNSTTVRRTFDKDMGDIVDALMEAMYKDAVGPGGVVDLTKVKSVQHIKEFKETPLGHRLWYLDRDNHHTVPKQWAKQLYINMHGEQAVPPGGWDAWLDDMPGFLMHRSEHVGPGTSSFHKILTEIVANDPPTNNAEILQRLNQAYGQWNPGDPELGSDVWKVAKTWLEGQGIQ